LKLLRSVRAAPPSAGPSPAQVLIARADAARDERRFRDAAALYSEALRIEPDQGPIHVQAGHMFKEARVYQSAQEHYEAAALLMPRDPDLALQLGHFFKVAGRPHEAVEAYRRAVELDAQCQDARNELEFLTASSVGITVADLGRATVAEQRRTGRFDELAPELLPSKPVELLHKNGESIHIRRLGVVERSSRWGDRTTLRGVQAIRGFCLSEDPIVELQILLNGRVIHLGPTREHSVYNEAENFRLRKYVFNVWLDFSTYPPGPYHVELRFRDEADTLDPEGGRRSHRETVLIDSPRESARFEGADSWTPSTDPADPRTVEEQINARPSVMSRARRAILETPVKSVLVLRTDQLGDAVVSLPALKRLRALFPEAKLVALVTSANADLMRTFGIFDEVITIPFPDEKEIQRKRVMTLEDQEALRKQLAAYRFDVALDLAPAVASRPLLLLSGAKLLAGMRDKTWPYLDVGFDFNTYDMDGRSDLLPASGKPLAFIEALGVLLAREAEVVRRPGLERSRLAAYGLAEGDRFVVLHTGARVVFSRWPHYNDIAARILAQTNAKVVMLSEDRSIRSKLPPSLLNDDRFQIIDTKIPFDDFDALLSFCNVFVGNDSGPKHLASLRGANVISLHTARINWGEWGQEHSGVVLHRHVPCAGCHVYNDPEECGKDIICVTNISPEEVWNAVVAYLDGLDPVATFEASCAMAASIQHKGEPD
jgi:ADP-heptose:LPS heptosyltransferase